MFDTLLFVHFLGVAIGAGTGIYVMAVLRHADRNLDQAEARTLVPGIVRAVSGVGSIGLVLLLLSGIAMAMIIGNGVWSGLFVAKMVLVAMLVMFLATLGYLRRRAVNRGDTRAPKIIRKISLLGPLLAVLTIFTAVLAFH